MAESTQEPTVIRWGIAGPGGIARTFARNLLQLAPAHPSRSREITHQITAIASSTSLTTAETFIATNITPYQPAVKCTAFSSYRSLATSTDVDIIYIATPHSSHFKTAMLVLEAGKPVLCEKPLCVNAAQAEKLITTAREKGLFLMEAMWTRFLPISGWIQDLVSSGTIGEVLRVTADFSMGCGDQKGVEEVFGSGVEGRMVNPDLAGGVLLDLGVYSLTWVFLSVYHLLPPDKKQTPNLLSAAMTPYQPTSTSDSTTTRWIDASSTLLLTLPSSPTGTSTCHAIATTSLYTSTDPGYGGDNPNDEVAHRYSTPSVRIQGSKGEIQVFGPLPRPQCVRVFIRVDADEQEIEGSEKVVVPGNVVDTGVGKGFRVEERVFESQGDGMGMFWEADEAGKCLRDGKLESSVMPLDETLVVMRVMDAARRMCGLDYGDVESVELK